MTEHDESPGLRSILGPPVLVAFGVFLLHMLPSDVFTVLTAWVLGSFPIGVLMGHCALSEE